MAGDVANPRIWLTGQVYSAPIGTTAPVTPTASLNVAFVEWGLIGEDGFTEGRDEDVSDHYAYGGILVRTRRAKHKRTFKFVALEDTPEVFDRVNPGSEAETDTGVTTRTVKVPQVDARAWVLHFTDGEITKRIVIPRGEITEVGETTWVDNELATREVTLTVYPASDGTLYLELTDDPQADVGA